MPNQPKIELRQATVSEWTELRDLRESPAMLQFEHPNRPSLTIEQERAWWDRRVLSGQYRVWAIVEGHAIAGFVNAFSFAKTPLPLCETGISVFPAYWRRGVATAAYARLLPMLRDELRMAQTWVGIHPDNVASLKLFEQLGYQYDGTLPDPPVDWIKMTLGL